MSEVINPDSQKESKEPQKHISITRVQYALVNPANGHIHAWGALDTICKVWAIEHDEIGNELKLEVRETNLVEIKTLSIEEIKKEMARQAESGIKPLHMQKINASGATGSIR